MKVFFFIASLTFAFKINTNDYKQLFANNDDANSPNTYVNFYKNFYDHQRNHQREKTILEKCKELMPVSRTLYSHANIIQQWVDYCVSLSEKQSFAL